MTIPIAAVLITKNEEAVIARCVKSVIGLGKVLVLDTGSTDRTMDEAREADAEVHGPSPMAPFHFAHARNSAMALVDSEWILSIDADEILRPGGVRAIQEAIQTFTECDVFELGFVQRAHKGAVPVADKKGRLFRKSAFEWKYRVHEVLWPKHPPARIAPLKSVVLEHFPEVDKSSRHTQNLDLLRICVQETPEHFFAWRELGMELVCRADAANARLDSLTLEAIKMGPSMAGTPRAARVVAEATSEKREAEALWAEACPALGRWMADAVDDGNFLLHSQDMMNYARCLARTGSMAEAGAWFDRAHRTAPERREPLWHAGNELLRKGEFREARRWFARAEAIPKSKMPKGFHLNDAAIWDRLAEESRRFCDAHTEGAANPVA